MTRDRKEGTGREDIFASIKSGKTRMRPRWRFVLQTWLSAIAGIFILVALLYLGTLTYAALHESGASFLPDFGLPGWYAFILSLPLLLIALTAAFIILFAIWMRRYSFGYREPLIYTVLAVIFLLVSAAFWAVRTSFYKALPSLGGFYNGFSIPTLNNVHRGAISSISEAGFTMMNEAGAAYNVLFLPDTRFPYGSDFHLGDIVIVFGELSKNGTISATGVEEVTPARIAPAQ